MKINQKTKRNYVKPSFNTIELQHHQHLLNMSGGRKYDPDDSNPFGNPDND